jgi:Replication-relaxation
MSVVTQRRYATTKRLAILRSQLSKRQYAILGDVARLGVVSGQQVRQLHFRGDQASRRLARLDLAELVESDVLVRLGRRVGGQHSGSDGYCYCLGVAGQRLIDPHRRRYRRPWEPGAAFLAHALSVSQLYADLRSAERRGSFGLVRFDAEPACWRRYAGPGGSRRWLKPDAHVVIESDNYEDRFFVETDRGTESAVRIEAKARAFISYYQSGREQSDDDVFPVVAFIVPDEQRRAQIIGALARVPADYWHLFTCVLAAPAAILLSDGSLVGGEPREDVS